jgi:hypothetical protein
MQVILYHAPNNTVQLHKTAGGPEAGLLGLFVVFLAFIVVFWWLQSIK